MPEYDEITLVEAAIRGDQNSFTVLCGRYYPALVAVAHSIIGDRHLAEDAAQQALASAAVKLPQLREKSRFGGWIATICRNAARDLLTGRPPTPDTLTCEPQAPSCQPDEQIEAVREALDTLPADAREVVYLRYYEGMTYENISAILGLSEQAINGRLRRAKKKIADYLQRQGYARVQP